MPPLSVAATDVDADGGAAEVDAEEPDELEHAARATPSNATALGPATFLICIKRYLSEG
jgi:hypothetical protein